MTGKQHKKQPRLRGNRFVDAETKHLLNREARRLGLSTNAYLRLVGKLSAALREGLSDGQPLDARKLVEWAENPLILSVIQMVCKYAIQQVESKDESAASDASNKEQSAPAPNPAQQNQQPNQRPQHTHPQMQFIDPLYGPVPEHMFPRQQRPLQTPPN